MNIHDGLLKCVINQCRDNLMGVVGEGSSLFCTVSRREGLGLGERFLPEREEQEPDCLCLNLVGPVLAGSLGVSRPQEGALSPARLWGAGRLGCGPWTWPPALAGVPGSLCRMPTGVGDLEQNEFIRGEGLC